MALRDLLWACPRCGEDRGLDRKGVCASCGTVFHRGVGAEIVARDPQGGEETRQAADWVDALPNAAGLLSDDPGRPSRAARVQARPVSGQENVFGETGFLNRVELYGPPVSATLLLYPDRIEVRWDRDPASVWPLERLTGVQASSSTLQLKTRGEPLVSFRFEDDSVYLWEILVHAALRVFYGTTGRGTILEFQPRIVTR